MPLTSCEECGKGGISSHAEKCPHCAAPAKIAFASYLKEQQDEKTRLEAIETQKNLEKETEAERENKARKRKSREGKNVGARYRPKDPDSWKSQSRMKISEIGAKPFVYGFIASMFGLIGDSIYKEMGFGIGFLSSLFVFGLYEGFFGALSKKEAKGPPMSPIENKIREKLEIPEERISMDDLAKFTSLDLSDCHIMDISELVDLTNLKPLGELEGIVFLDLTNCSIPDLSGLEYLKDLKDLHLARNAITDLKPLTYLKNLRYLQISNNPSLSDDQLERLKDHLPNCLVKDGNRTV